MSWQKLLAQGFASIHELLEFLELPAELGSSLAEQSFKTRLPLRFAQQIEKGNPNDPLLLQVLASAKELSTQPFFTTDPLAEQKANPLPGLIHKYSGRVLVMLTGACAIHCRYCFRRHFPYANNQPNQQQWKDIIAYLTQHQEIHEIIFSGGDPLLITDKRWQDLLSDLQPISHLRTLRFHSRVPIVLPERIETWVQLFDAQRFHLVLVVHCNHPNELTIETAQSMKVLKQAGFHLLNQSVLLKGVNDNVDTLTQLSRKLFEFGILPYYLHLLDQVEGAAHFDLALDQALKIYRALQARLPGYLVPRLAKEEAGKMGKTLWV